MQAHPGRRLDAIADEVVRNGLATIADELGSTHVRAAYSSVVRGVARLLHRGMRRHGPGRVSGSLAGLAAGDDAVPIAYTVIVSHMFDVGCPHPGGVAVASRSLWDEGLVLPLVPVVQSHVPNQILLNVIAANTSDPDKVPGDIRSVLAGSTPGPGTTRRRGARGHRPCAAWLHGHTRRHRHHHSPPRRMTGYRLQHRERP